MKEISRFIKCRILLSPSIRIEITLLPSLSYKIGNLMLENIVFFNQVNCSNHFFVKCTIFECFYLVRKDIHIYSRNQTEDLSLLLVFRLSRLNDTFYTRLNFNISLILILKGFSFHVDTQSLIQ